jgi:hypothetical protein
MDRDTRFSAERDEVGGTHCTGRHSAGASNGIAGEGRTGMPEEAGS